MQVLFENVGRKKMSWSAELPSEGATVKWLLTQVKAHRAVMSRDIEIAYVDNGGNIYAGMRNVGTFKIVGA